MLRLESAVFVPGDSPVKSSIIVVGILIAIVVLWYMGYAEKFLGPWASWANFIGYFQ
jgi:hypothetical protein